MLLPKYCTHFHHTSAALKRHFPDSLVAPLPNSEQINHPFLNHTYTKSMPNHIHDHYAPFVKLTHNTHHLFDCTHTRTTLLPLDLWTDPAGITALLAGWTEKLAGGPQAGRYLHHTSAALKRHFPDSLVAPLPYTEQINHPFSNHTYTKSTPNYINDHYTPFVKLTHNTHHLQLHPHTHHVVTPGFVDRPRRNNGTAGQMAGKVGWWTTRRKIPPHLHHTSAALKRHFPDSLVAPLPNSEQINHPFSNHTYTKSKPNYIHDHYAPFVKLTHTTHHLFNYTHTRTTLLPLDLWTDPAGMTALLARWTEKLAGGPQSGRSTPPPNSRGKGVCRLQQTVLQIILRQI